MKIFEKGLAQYSEIYLSHDAMEEKDPFFTMTSVSHCGSKSAYTSVPLTVDGYMLLFIAQGEGKLHHQEVTVPLKKGSLALLCSQAKDTFEVSSESDWYALTFDGHYMDSLYPNSKSTVISMKTPDALGLFDRLLSSYQSGHQPEHLLVTKTIFELLQQFGGKEQGRFQNVFDYVNAHLSERISVGELASLAGLSTFYFIRSFNEATGMTPHEYLIRVRVQTSAFLLKATNLTLGEITQACGFSNESAFNNTFKRLKGITPMGFRKSAQTGRMLYQLRDVQA